MDEVSLPKPLLIRYDGLDADQHQIEIDDLAASLKGIGRIIGVVATFAVTQRLAQHRDARPIRVLVGPPKDNCLTFLAVMHWVDQHQTISGIASGLIVTLIGYVFSRAAGKTAEMKHLKELATEAIKQLGNRDEAVIARLLDTVDKMADTLKPSARQAVRPVGSTASQMSIGSMDSPATAVVVDKITRDAIEADAPPEIGNEARISVRFVEMNLDSRGCRIAMGSDEEQRFAAEITDPELLVPNNAYATAFAAQTELTVRAKPTLRDGEIDRWYISAHD